MCVHSTPGQAYDRCLFSRADLIVARHMAYFGPPVFHFLNHVLINRNINAAIKKFLQDRVDKGLTADTQTAQEDAEELARRIHGNVWDVPLYAREVTVDGVQVSLQPHLKDALVVPPIMHIQVFSFSSCMCTRMSLPHPIHGDCVVIIHCCFCCFSCIECRIV
jgi:hypothetical protein